MNSQQLILKTPLLFSQSAFQRSIERNFTRLPIKNYFGLFMFFSYRRFNRRVTPLPLKTIDGEWGRLNDRSAIYPTPLTQHPNTKVKKNQYFGFRRERLDFKNVRVNKVIL